MMSASLSPVPPAPAAPTPLPVTPPPAMVAPLTPSAMHCAKARGSSWDRLSRFGGPCTASLHNADSNHPASRLAARGIDRETCCGLPAGVTGSGPEAVPPAKITMRSTIAPVRPISATTDECTKRARSTEPKPVGSSGRRRISTGSLCSEATALAHCPSGTMAATQVRASSRNDAVALAAIVRAPPAPPPAPVPAPSPPMALALATAEPPASSATASGFVAASSVRSMMSKMPGSSDFPAFAISSSTPGLFTTIWCRARNACRKCTSAMDSSTGAAAGSSFSPLMYLSSAIVSLYGSSRGDAGFDKNWRM
mmetsp:Transcript_140067/g.340362  ORF Transcript_140067/g.340362 Transcript_140067/m.340362 type:complete len:310 (+) Transcript_140067:1715-2644(+)